MAPRARRTADIAASVPDDTSRTSSTLAIASTIRVASSTSASVGIPKLVPARRRCGRRLDDRRVRVAEQQRAPGLDEVDVARAGRVLDPRALAARRGTPASRPPTRRPARVSRPPRGSPTGRGRTTPRSWSPARMLAGPCLTLPPAPGTLPSMQLPPDEPIEKVAAELPERPKLVTPGRVDHAGPGADRPVRGVAVAGRHVRVGDELKHVAPGWFVVMAACEVLSYGCMWLLIGLCLGSSRYFAIGTAQVVGNAVSKIVPGGSPMGAAMQYRMLVGAGMDADADRHRHGGRVADQRRDAVRAAGARGAGDRRRGRRRPGPRARRLARCGGVRAARRRGRGAAVVGPADRRRRAHDRADPQHAAAPSPADDRPRGAAHAPSATPCARPSGEQWGQAILRSAGNVLFDYLALLAALVASGSRPRASLVLLAYVASVVLGMIPITPGGLGFVEAGLAAMLVLAGVPGPGRDAGDARLPAGVVLGTDPRRPGRVRAVPAPGSAVAGGGARPGRYRERREPSGASSCSWWRFGWWWPGRPSGVSSFS